MPKYLVFETWDDADRAERIISKWQGFPMLQDGKFNVTTRFDIPVQRVDGKWQIGYPNREEHLQGLDMNMSIEEISREKLMEYFPTATISSLTAETISIAGDKIAEAIRSIRTLNSIDESVRKNALAYLRAADTLLDSPQPDRSLIKEVLSRAGEVLKLVPGLHGLLKFIKEIVALF